MKGDGGSFTHEVSLDIKVLYTLDWRHNGEEGQESTQGVL